MGAHNHHESKARGGVVEPLRQAVKEEKHNMQQMAHDVADAVRDKVADMRDTAQHAAAELRDGAGEKMNDMREAAGQYYEAGRKQAVELERTVEGRIRSNPMTALAIAGGLGLVVGIIWARRR